MYPYLERPCLWRQVHTGLIVEIQHYLSHLLRPRYYVAIEQHTYLTLLPPPEHRVGVPDIMILDPPGYGAATADVMTAPVMIVGPVPFDKLRASMVELPQQEEVKHRYLEIRDTETQAVITTIEILSPANKIGREGREQYQRKRLKVLNSLTNLVEINLLRTGKPMPMSVSYQKDYRIIVSRSEHRPRAQDDLSATLKASLFNVPDIIPNFPVPLRPGEDEPLLPLNQLLHELYDKSSYDLMIDYRQPSIPPLSEANAAWAQSILERTTE